jgi:hypothetical protein
MKEPDVHNISIVKALSKNSWKPYFKIVLPDILCLSLFSPKYYLAYPIWLFFYTKDGCTAIHQI